MRLSKVKYLLIPVLMISIINISLPQKKLQKYQNERKALEGKIRLGRKVLNDLEKEEKVTMGELRAIKEQISNQQALINNLNYELKFLREKEEEIGGDILALQSDTSRLKKEYAAMIYHAAKVRNSSDDLAFLFSAQTYAQLSKRIEYLRQFTSLRKTQVEQINKVLESLGSKFAELEAAEKQQVKVLNKLKKEKQAFDYLRFKQDKYVEKIRKRESEQRVEINQWVARQKELEKLIKKLIAEQTKKETNLTLIERQELALKSKNFEANKARLPWPVRRCLVTRKFGARKNDLGIIENNLGVGLTADRDAPVRSVFDGSVAMVRTIRGQNKMVMLKHGKYITVYINLRNIKVKPGETVSVGQQLGTVSTNSQGLAELEFQVWKGNGADPIKYDPERWLTK